MHSRLFGTSILALTLASILNVACTKSDSPGTTGTTGADAGVRVSQIDIGRSLAADKTINASTDSFKPNDTIYASVATEGTAAAPATLQARWTYQDGQVVNEATQRIAPAGNARTEFHISKPDGWPAGKYKLEVFLNGSSAGTKDIEVER
jgi:uncharacterized protein YfaS (alpha-2-macroglobulin family)